VVDGGGDLAEVEECTLGVVDSVLGDDESESDGELFVGHISELVEALCVGKSGVGIVGFDLEEVSEEDSESEESLLGGGVGLSVGVGPGGEHLFNSGRNLLVGEVVGALEGREGGKSSGDYEEKVSVFVHLVVYNFMAYIP